MPIQNGSVAVSFGFITTTGGITLAAPGSGTNTYSLFGGNFLLQSGDVALGATNVRVADEIGNVVNSSWFDQHRKGTLEWIPKGANAAAAAAAVTIGGIVCGDFISISACASMADLVAVWEIMDVKVAKGNDSAAKMTFTLEYRSGVQARLA